MGHGGAVLAARRDLAVEPRDDALRHAARKVHRLRVADRKHLFAHLDLVGVAEGRRGQVLGVDLDDREVGLTVRADQPPLIGGAVAQLHGDPLRALDHMRVGHDVAVLADDDPAAHALGLVVLVVHIGGDRHDGGGDLFDDLLARQLAARQRFPGRLRLILQRDARQVVGRNVQRRAVVRRGRSARVLPHAAVDPDARQRHQRHHQHRRQNDPEDHQALVAAARLGLGRLLVVGDVPLVGVPALRATPVGTLPAAARRILVGGQVLRRLLPPALLRPRGAALIGRAVALPLVLRRHVPHMLPASRTALRRTVFFLMRIFVRIVIIAHISHTFHGWIPPVEASFFCSSGVSIPQICCNKIDEI